MNRCDCPPGTSRCDRCDPRIARVEDQWVVDGDAADEAAARCEHDMWGAA